jgi:transcriptional regulator with XRE-family HTH domain
MSGHGTWHDTMTEDEKVFSANLGRRVGELRRQQGFTQAQLGELLGISQQKVAAIEIGTRRVAVATLPALARSLAVTIEELLGEKSEPAKRGPIPKLARHMQRIAQLPKAQQRFVLQVLDSVLQQTGR